MASGKPLSRLLVLLSMAILLGAEVYAQTGSIRGQIVDENEQPVDGVEILFKFLGGVNREHTAKSEEDGDFIRAGLPTGRYQLSFTKSGHQSYQYEVKVLGGPPTRLGKVVLPTLSEGARSDLEQRKLNQAIASVFKDGVAAMSAEDFAGAIAAFEKVLEIDPDQPEALYNLGVAHENLGQIDQAVTFYKKAIELQTSAVEPYLALAAIHTANQQWPEAMAMLQEAEKLQPDDVSIVFDIGAVAMNAVDIPAAERAFQRVVELDDAHALGHYQLGMVYVNQGKSEEAIAQLEKYLELEPDGPQAATATGLLGYLKTN